MENKELQISRLKKKIRLIKKALDSNDNTWGYTEKDLEDVKKQLEKFENEN